MGIMLLLIQRKWVMFGNFLSDDSPKGKRPKYRVCTHPLGKAPSRSLTLVQKEALSIWN